METITSPGLRERKAAKLKLLLVELLTEELKEKSFQDVNVEVLCEKAMISKVTFYNYFPEKDDLLRYFLSLWVYRIIMECYRLKKEGFEAVRYIFEDMAASQNQNPTLYGNMLSIMTLKGKYHYIEELTLAEKAALYPDPKLYTLDVKLSVGQFLEVECQKAIDRGEIKSTFSAKDLNFMIGSFFHGSCIIGFRINNEKPGDGCLRALEMLSKLILK